MESRHLIRLQEEQRKAISETEARIEQCKKFKSDYRALQQRLHTLPDTVTHEIMVPFGKLGFMPGQLVHTNEVLVLLGDNWFAERSAKQAKQIAGRRMQELDKQIESLQDQMKLLAPRLDFTSDLQAELQGEKGVQEIVEEYDEEKEREWDEQHRQNMKKHREQMRQNMSKEDAPTKDTNNSSRPQTDEDLWARLDELEQLEKEQGDLDSSVDNSDGSDTEKNAGAEVKNKQRVRWADESRHEGIQQQLSIDSDDDGDDDDDDGDESDDESEDEDDVPSVPQRKITFTHSKTPPAQPKETRSCDGPVISSPADIYKLYRPTPILKKTSSQDETPSTQHATSEKPSFPQPVSELEPRITSDQTSTAQRAFSGKIVERPTGGSRDGTVPATASGASTKRVSRFKAQRMQQTSS